MDRYVKHVKRKDDNVRLQSNAAPIIKCHSETVSSSFYFPYDVYENDKKLLGNELASTSMTDPLPAEQLWPLPPATPQKSFLSSSFEMDSPDYASGHSSRVSVARRLRFDDDYEDADNTMNVDNCSSDGYCLRVGTADARQQQQPPPNVRTAIATYSLRDDDDRFRTIVETLSARGFVVVNQPRQQQPQSTAEHDDDDDGDNVGEEERDGVSTVRHQFECLSVLEGVVYGVRAASREHASPARSTGVLAAVGPHPNIVSYFSSWTDARFHYVQTELCPENLASAADRFDRAADFRTVVEHVACALHYLHGSKGYAHNRVNRWNVYRTTADGGDRAVYKLGGFRAATALAGPAAEDPAALADVRSLCATVLRLMRYGDGCTGDGDAVVLRAYLSSVAGSADGRPNALSVWRWCCEARQQQRQRPCRMQYGDAAVVNCGGGGGPPMDLM